MDAFLKILILEDNESDAGLVIRSLKKAGVSFDYLRVDTREEFIQGLNEYAPNLILSDHSLPQFNSLDAYNIYKELDLAIPFILVTGTVSEEFAVKCLHEGIDDYILKDNLTRLSTSIENALNKKALELKKRELEREQLDHLEKLRLQNEELVKTNKELDRFVYSASHELKAPLTAVLGLIQITTMELNQKNYDAFPEYLRMMSSSVNKLNITVAEIVNYSINNRTEISTQIIEFDHLITEVFDKLSYLDGINNVTKEIVIEQNCPWYCDKNRLIVLFDNLISNAFLYRDIKKEPFIGISVHVFAEKISIKIEDNGLGIVPEHVKNIFNMFYKASSLSEGPGLGLYIVKETLEKLNGEISVDSKLGLGTIFEIELPNFYLTENKISNQTSMFA